MTLPPTSHHLELKSYETGREESTAALWLERLGADSSLAEEASEVARAHCKQKIQIIDWFIVLGLSLWHQQRYEEADEWLNRVNPENITSTNFFVIHGMVQRKMQGGEERALKSYRRALKLDPNRYDVLFNIGNLLKEDYPGEAIPYYEKSIILDSRNAAAWHNYALALNESEKTIKSIVALKISLRLNPLDADAWCNLGLAKFGNEQFENAKQCFRHAISLDKNHATSHVNFGQVLVETLEPEEALEYLSLGRKLSNSSANSLWNYSLALLLLGHYKEGWKYYEARFSTKQFDNQSTPSNKALPRRMQALPKQNEPELIVWSEQGLGDGIQFCRYLNLLESIEVPYKFIAHKQLVSLYKDWLNLGDRVSACIQSPKFNSEENTIQEPFHIPLMSLPHLFGTELDTIPSMTPYLAAPNQPPERLKVPEAPGGITVGIVWATNPKNKAMYKNKSIPLFTLMPGLMQLIKLDLISLHSLQVGEDAEQLLPWRSESQITEWKDKLTDFSDTAHVINQLDLIITVDTAAAHLAGALHKPTWLLLAHNADFRWLHKRTDSPWYPTMRLFRQKTRGNWPDVVKQVENAFDELFILDINSLASAKTSK